MAVLVPIPGDDDLVLEHLVFDVNGTLSDRGEPIVAALKALARLRAALGIAVIGPEGTHRSALDRADVVALSIDEALGLLAEPRTLTATLRP